MSSSGRGEEVKQLDEWAAKPERQLRSLDPATSVVRLTPMCVRGLQVQF